MIISNDFWNISAFSDKDTIFLAKLLKIIEECLVGYLSIFV